MRISLLPDPVAEHCGYYPLAVCRKNTSLFDITGVSTHHRFLNPQDGSNQKNWHFNIKYLFTAEFL